MGYEELERMTPEAREKYLEIIRSIPPGKKLRMIADHNDSVKEFVKAGIRGANPDINEAEVRKEIIRRSLPPDIVRKVYGW